MQNPIDRWHILLENTRRQSKKDKTKQNKTSAKERNAEEYTVVRVSLLPSLLDNASMHSHPKEICLQEKLASAHPQLLSRPSVYVKERLKKKEALPNEERFRTHSLLRVSVLRPCPSYTTTSNVTHKTKNEQKKQQKRNMINLNVTQPSIHLWHRDTVIAKRTYAAGRHTKA